MTETKRNVAVASYPAAAHNEDDDGHADCNRTVERETPRERDQPVRIGEGDEEDDPD